MSLPTSNTASPRPVDAPANARVDHSQSIPRVLVLARDLRSGGGVVDYIAMLMQALAGEVQWDHLLIGRRPSEGQRAALSRLLGDYLAFTRRLLTTRHDLVQLNPSFIDKSLPRDLVFVALGLLFGRAPLVVFIHGWSWAMFQRIRRRRLLSWCVGSLLGRTRSIVVLSEQFREALLDLGVPAARVEVVTTMFNGIDLSTARAAAPDAGPLRLLFLARLIRDKGIFETIEAVPLLVAKGVDVQLLVAGAGPDLESVRDLVRRHRLEKRVQFLGYVRGAAKCEALAGSHVYILASQREGCPVSMLEAMACGLPVVATSVGAIPDIVATGENGVLINEITPEAIAAAVGKLCSPAENWQRISDANHAKAWQRYESRAVAAQMLQLYRRSVGWA